MKSRKFLIVSLGSWAYSLGFHLLLFTGLLLISRNRFLYLSAVDLDLNPIATTPARSVGSPPLDEEEWRKPNLFKKRLITNLQPNAAVETSFTASPMTMGAGANGTQAFKSVAQLSKRPVFIPGVDLESIYPYAAKHANIEGVVMLLVDIDVTGTIKNVQLLKGLGYGCDEAAITTVWKSRFTPAYIGTEPVPTRIRLPIGFHFITK